MKKKLTELTPTERHFVLAQVLDVDVRINNGQLVTLSATERPFMIAPAYLWNPDKDKALMWDLMEELRKDMGLRRYIFAQHMTLTEETQFNYIYHKLGTDEVEVPEMGE